MDGALELIGPTDQRIELAASSAFGELRGKGLEDIRRQLVFVAHADDVGTVVRATLGAIAVAALATELRNTVRDVLKQVETRDVLRAQHRDGKGIGLLEDRDQQVADLDLLIVHILKEVIDHLLAAVINLRDRLANRGLGRQNRPDLTSRDDPDIIKLENIERI